MIVGLLALEGLRRVVIQAVHWSGLSRTVISSFAATVEKGILYKIYYYIKINLFYDRFLKNYRPLQNEQGLLLPGGLAHLRTIWVTVALPSFLDEELSPSAPVEDLE